MSGQSAARLSDPSVRKLKGNTFLLSVKRKRGRPDHAEFLPGVVRDPHGVRRGRHQECPLNNRRKKAIGISAGRSVQANTSALHVRTTRAVMVTSFGAYRPRRIRRASLDAPELGCGPCAGLSVAASDACRPFRRGCAAQRKSPPGICPDTQG